MTQGARIGKYDTFCEVVVVTRRFTHRYVIRKIPAIFILLGNGESISPQGMCRLAGRTDIGIPFPTTWTHCTISVEIRMKTMEDLGVSRQQNSDGITATFPCANLTCHRMLHTICKWRSKIEMKESPTFLSSFQASTKTFSRTYVIRQIEMITSTGTDNSSLRPRNFPSPDSNNFQYFVGT